MRFDRAGLDSKESSVECSLCRNLDQQKNTENSSKMGWLNNIDIGHDLQICPDCDREYEVLKQFLGGTQNRVSDWIDAVFNDAYYVELRCPQCLETRYLCIQALTSTQFYTEKEKETKR